MRSGCAGPRPRYSGTPFIDLPPMPDRESQNDYVFILIGSLTFLTPFKIVIQRMTIFSMCQLIWICFNKIGVKSCILN
jgi:hypothetical protein